jgi:hypothetical protein
MVIITLLLCSTVSLSAQKFVDISGFYQAPAGSIFVDTTGYASLDSIPRDVVPDRIYASFFIASVSTAENPCKHISSDSSCRTGTVMNTSTEKLLAAHDSASRYYPGSLWCVPELSMNSDDHTIYIQLEEIEHQYTFFGRFKIWSATYFWYISDPVSVEETQTRSPRDRFAVYPNPTSTSLTVTSDSQSAGSPKRLTIRLYDALGQHVADTEINDGESIDVSALGNGAYRAVISEGDRNSADASVVQFIVNR